MQQRQQRRVCTNDINLMTATTTTNSEKATAIAVHATRERINIATYLKLGRDSFLAVSLPGRRLIAMNLTGDR